MHSVLAALSFVGAVVAVPQAPPAYSAPASSAVTPPAYSSAAVSGSASWSSAAAYSASSGAVYSFSSGAASSSGAVYSFSSGAVYSSGAATPCTTEIWRSSPVASSSSYPTGPVIVTSTTTVYQCATTDPWGTGSSAGGYAASTVAAYSASSAGAYSGSSAAAYSGSSAATYTVTSAVATPSGSAYPACWSSCFAQAQISDEAELCGNTAVDACIQEECTAAEDQAYWAWYESYCPAPTSTSAATYTVTSAVATSTSSAYPACWSSCFAQAQISGEAELCGNTAVDACIQEECTAAEDQAYWAWYESYCPASSDPSSSPVSYAPSSTPVSAPVYSASASSPVSAPVYSASASPSAPVSNSAEPPAYSAKA